MNDSLRRLVPVLIAVAAWAVMTGLVGVLAAGAFTDMGPAGGALAVAAAALLSLVALSLPGAVMGERPLGVLALGAGAVVLLLAVALFFMGASGTRRAMERYRRPPLIDKAGEEAPPPAPEANAPAASAEGSAPAATPHADAGAAPTGVPPDTPGP
ncbi:MAG: hypothetical protein GXP47_08545 [Acidobacteria bacterium]|nr:hypothetical protein [Acidobacteriota bacterium]